MKIHSFLINKSKISYQSVPTSYRQISLLNGFSNSTLQEHFGVNKPFLKEVGEEESIQELQDYCWDDSTFSKQPEEIMNNWNYKDTENRKSENIK